MGPLSDKRTACDAAVRTVADAPRRRHFGIQLRLAGTERQVSEKRCRPGNLSVYAAGRRPAGRAQGPPAPDDRPQGRTDSACARRAPGSLRSTGSSPESSPEQQPARTYTSELLAVEDPFKRSDKLPRTPVNEGEYPKEPSTPGADETATKPAASPPLTPENDNGAAMEVAESTAIPTSIDRRVFNVVAILAVLAALTGGALVAQSDGGLAGTVEVITQTVDQFDMATTCDEAARAMNNAFTTGSTAIQTFAGATHNMTIRASDTLAPYGQQLSTDAASVIVFFSEQCEVVLTMAADQWVAFLTGIKLQMSAGSRVAELEAQVAELKAELQSGTR